MQHNLSVYFCWVKQCLVVAVQMEYNELVQKKKKQNKTFIGILKYSVFRVKDDSGVYYTAFLAGCCLCQDTFQQRKANHSVVLVMVTGNSYVEKRKEACFCFLWPEECWLYLKFRKKAHLTHNF